MLTLTARQQQILDLIKKAIQHTGFPPTRAEIAAELGFRSANAAEEHLQALARKGAIIIAAGTSRGIRLTDHHPHPTTLLTLKLIGGVAAGPPTFSQEQLQTSYQVDPALFCSKPDYLLKVRGMSMRDAGILEGDLLAIKKTNSVKNGEVVVARLGDEVTVKRYFKKGHVIQLIPENPDFQTIIVPEDQEDFSLEGKVIGLLRNAI